ncbi:polyhomeotic-like protein 1 [Anopheles stephensi]|uniref:polyhomeotic-like protein 1 n=1 Tax=Anopheles stephensi TaxID=30069 RepID=UPI001658B2D6|nr:polyhomeotic-like protein 1 [Anopheles stephensi]XP_035894749.1 polyhomeotic-like protein 1 [Anopheles stephensi]
MSCHSTTRAQEDPYAFTESAPLQANSLAYANHSSAVSNSSSSNNNATTTTTTTIQTASSGASLLLTTNSAGSVTASKDKPVSISPATVTSPATLKVRYNGVVTTASPTATTVVRAPGTVGTTIPVFTKPVQIKQQQSQLQGNLSVQSSPTVTVGKLIKKVLPQQKTPMITTVVAGGAKIISRLQQPNQTSPGQQLSTTGGSILKFIKIPPQQLAKGVVGGGGGGIPQGSFIHVTTSSDGARKLLVTNSSSSNGVSPTISVATSSARIANVATVNAVNRNASGVAVVSNVSTVSPTKIRLIQPQAQGKFYLQATNSNAIGTTAHLSNPVTIATLRNTLIKQHQLQQQQQQQQQSPTQPQQKQQQPAPPQQQQQILLQKPSQQQQTPPSPNQQQSTPQPVQQQPKQQPQQQQQPVQKQQKAPQLKQQSIVGNQVSPQPLPHTLSKTSSQNADSTQKLQPKPQSCSVQSQSQQQPQAVSKALLQSTPNGQKQSLLLQHQQQQQQPSPKQAPHTTIPAATPPAKLQPAQQQPQSLLLQPQRKQQQQLTASAGTKQRTVPQQQSPKPATSTAPISLLTSSANATKDGSLLAKVNEASRMTVSAPKEENAGKMTDLSESVRRPANQQSLLLVGSNVETETATKSPKSTDQSSPVVGRVEKIIRSPSSPVEPTVNSVAMKKRPSTEEAPSSVSILGERKASEESTHQDTKPMPAIKEEELMPAEDVNGKVRAMSGRKSTVTGKSAGKQQQKSSKRTHSQHSLGEEQEPFSGRESSPVGNIGTSPSCTTSTPNAPGKHNPPSPPIPSLLASVKLEKEFEIKQEVMEQDEKPSKQRLVALGTVPGAIVVPIKCPKLREWHAPGAYLFDLKDPGDESDDDVYDEYPNTLSCWYEETIEITVPESSGASSCWGLNPMHRSSASSSGSVRGKGKGHHGRSANSAKFEIRMLSRDERLELKKAYLQRRVVQCRNGLRMRSAAASTAKKRLESMAKMVEKLDKRRQIELNKSSEKATCISDGCNKSALVMTSHCYDHITEDADQCLFQRCTAKFSDNSQCRVPVFDISHELILCKEHAWKHDNHDKMSQEVKLHKKPPANVSTASTVASPTIIAGRKKAKQPIQQPPQVVVRSQKRPKKKKKLTPLQQQMLLHQQQYKQQFLIHHPNHHSNQAASQQQQQAKLTAAPPANQPQRKMVVQQPQKSLLNASSANGKVQVQLKSAMTPLPKASIVVHPAQQQQQSQRLHLSDGSENPPKTATFNSGVLHTAAQANRILHIPAAVGSNRTVASGFTGTTVLRGQHKPSVTREIVDRLEHEHDQQQKQQPQIYTNGTHSVQTTLNHSSPANTQELLTICENSSAYASSEDTGVGGLSESELLATQDVIEEIIPFEFSNLLHPNMLSHLPPDELNDLLGLADVPAEDDTGDSHQSCPREVEDDIERALEHVKSLDDMTVEPSSLLGDFLDNVDDEMLDGSDMCATTEQMLQSSNKPSDIRGMVHT